MIELTSKLDDLFKAFEGDNTVNLDEYREGIYSSLRDLKKQFDGYQTREEKLIRLEEENLIFRRIVAGEIISRSILLGNRNYGEEETLTGLPADELLKKRKEVLDICDRKFGSHAYEIQNFGNDENTDPVNKTININDFK
ncbi:MAG: hypothetical protein GY863_14720 [bacterium]|nr:hypothetical protein [bacterium]